MASPTHSLEKFEILKSLILNSTMTVALTGAGVSTLSGIPDFRSAGEVCLPVGGYDVEECSPSPSFGGDPTSSTAGAMSSCTSWNGAPLNHPPSWPSSNKGYLQGLFTQNIDMLHKKAAAEVLGDPQRRAPQLHELQCHYSYEQIADLEKGRVRTAPGARRSSGLISSSTGRTSTQRS